MDLRTLPGVEDLVAAAVREDLGRGDVTTRAVLSGDASADAVIAAKQGGVAAGLPLLSLVFDAAGGGVDLRGDIRDGSPFGPGTILCRLQGRVSTLLAGERVALNFLQHLSGVATATRRLVDAVAGTRARIIDTRKTLPGLRVLEKYAVRMGGGSNHRFGLDDGILIKDNHIAAAGSVRAAVERARRAASHGLEVEVECETVQQVDEALAAGAEIILLDNMSPLDLRAAVARVGGRAVVEASGGIGAENVRSVAEAGVDLISVGAITHSAAAVDISMRLAARTC